MHNASEEQELRSESDLHLRLLKEEKRFIEEEEKNRVSIVPLRSQVTDLFSAFHHAGMRFEERVGFCRRHVFGRPHFWKSFHEVGQGCDSEARYNAHCTFVRAACVAPERSAATARIGGMLRRMAVACHLHI